MRMNRTMESIANMLLRQMGAVEIKSMNASVNKVKFKLDADINVTYIYEAKENEEVHLSRVRPYARFLGVCKNEGELVSMIERDYIMFRIVYDSPSFESYLEIMKKMQDLTDIMEPLFMEKRTNPDELLAVTQAMDEVYEKVEVLRNQSDCNMEEQIQEREKEYFGFTLSDILGK